MTTVPGMRSAQERAGAAPQPRERKSTAVSSRQLAREGHVRGEEHGQRHTLCEVTAPLFRQLLLHTQVLANPRSAWGPTHALPLL